jgi:ParB-like chromosome segregation protein Spo0J
MKTSKSLAQAFQEGEGEHTSPVQDYGLGLVAIGLGQLVPCRWQPRQTFDAGALLELALDIQQHGVLTPPLVWENEDHEYELIAGERRVRACWALALAAAKIVTPLSKAVELLATQGIGGARVESAARFAAAPDAQRFTTVPCRLVLGSAAELHELALVDNFQREDLSPIEEGHALHDLLQEYGYTQRELADRLGKSQTWISQRLTLLNLAPAVADQVASGEVDSATAREIARLAPAVQAQTVAHLQKHNLKSKAAQAFVQRVIDMSEPAHYTAGPGSTSDSGRTLVGIALQQIPDPAARQQAVVQAAATTGDGKLTNGLDARELLVASGIAGVGKTRYDINVTELWKRHAPAAGYGCATCQLNAQRPLVAEVNALADAHKESNVGDAGWPRCAPGVTTCRAYTAPGSVPSLTLSWFGSSFVLTPEEQAHVTDSWPRRCDDVVVWADVIRRYYAHAAAKSVEVQDAKESGLRRALAKYLTLQRSGELTPAANSQHQPCNRCVFHKVDADDPDAHCQFQANPPDWSDYDTAVIRIWASGNQTIGRCRLFRLKQPEVNLPDVPGGIELEPAGLLYLLRRVSQKESYGAKRWGPRWLEAKRAKVQDEPPWSACEPALAQLIPVLSPGRRLALLLLWEDPFHWQGIGYGNDTETVEAYVPELGRVVPYTLKETINR